MRTVVLYHAGCYDGFGAAWAAWRKFGEEATYLPVKYGDPFPDVAWDCDLYIVDFSYPRNVLESRALDPSYCINVTDLRVLDHHKTAQADLAGLPFCTFDMNKSGARLAWEYFHGASVPELILYIEDRDLWRFALPGSREAAMYLRAEPFDFRRWNDLKWKFGYDFDDQVLRDGAAMLRLERQQVDLMCRQFVWIELGGHRVPAANATVFFSEVGDRLCELHPDAPFAAYWMDRGDGKRQWGLRSRGGCDVAAVAKLYGGGGHAAAAGFVEVMTPSAFAVRG